MLNDLVTINNDRMEGYKKVEKQVNTNLNLSSVFRDKWQQSFTFITELQQNIKLLGGNYTDNMSLPGKIFNIWMGFKNTLKRDNTSTILDSCEFGEDMAIKAYNAVLQSEVGIPAGIRQLIQEQQTAIKKSYDLVKKYKDLNLDFQNYDKSFLL
ncbi:MAG: PA2169 family four-helix-bundle protein [Bacteroidota bacterium]